MGFWFRTRPGARGQVGQTSRRPSPEKEKDESLQLIQTVAKVSGKGSVHSLDQDNRTVTKTSIAERQLLRVSQCDPPHAPPVGFLTQLLIISTRVSNLQLRFHDTPFKRIDTEEYCKSVMERLFFRIYGLLFVTYWVT